MPTSATTDFSGYGVTASDRVRYEEDPKNLTPNLNEIPFSPVVLVITGPHGTLYGRAFRKIDPAHAKEIVGLVLDMTKGQDMNDPKTRERVFRMAMSRFQ